MMKTDTQTYSKATIHASLFILAGRIFINEVDKDFIEVLKAPDMLEILNKLQPGFSGYINNTTWDATQLELLAADYCQLFILPNKQSLSLHASHWQTEEAIDISQLEQLMNQYLLPEAILSIGVTTKLPTDHLGILLYFIAALYSSNEPDTQLLGQQATKYFLQPWAPSFVENSTQITNNLLYLVGGKLLLTLFMEKTHEN